MPWCVIPPISGLAFMGHEWDRPGQAMTVGAGRESLPGIGERDVGWPSNAGWNQMRCRHCGHLGHGGSPCACDDPDFGAADERWLLFQIWCMRWAYQCRRVLKPGGHLLSFGGSRTFHRLVCGVEDAGFEVRDTLLWLYSKGMPKSGNVAKAIDKLLGVEGTYGDPKSPDHAAWINRGNDMRGANGSAGHEGWQRPWMDDEEAVERAARRYIPGSAEAKQWDGWGSALKPAFEPIVLARKPMPTTLGRNVLAHGTGALNIDGCRIDYVDDTDRALAKPQGRPTSKGGGAIGATPDAGRDLERADFEPEGDRGGRWPANVVLDEEAAALLDEATGTLRSGAPAVRRTPIDELTHNTYGGNESRPPGAQMIGYGDSGGASRFFYVAKVSQAERQLGVTDPGGNTHATVKPIALMRWLVRLVCPPGGLVLDPFAGSGSTGVAALREDVRFIGIERDPDYLRIAQQRLDYEEAAPTLEFWG